MAAAAAAAAPVSPSSCADSNGSDSVTAFTSKYNFEPPPAAGRVSKKSILETGAFFEEDLEEEVGGEAPGSTTWEWVGVCAGGMGWGVYEGGCGVLGGRVYGGRPWGVRGIYGGRAAGCGMGGCMRGVPGGAGRRGAAGCVWGGRWEASAWVWQERGEAPDQRWLVQWCMIIALGL